jgi:hypothetical protein
MREPCGKLGMSTARWREVGRGIYHMVRVIWWHVGLQCAHSLAPRAAAPPFIQGTPTWDDRTTVY